MKNFRLASLAGALALAAGLSACGTPDPYGPNNYPVSSVNRTETYQTYPAGAYPYGQYPAQPVAGVEWGRVTNVALISNGQGSYSPNRSGAGTVIGAVVGGLLGNTIGAGSGRAAATVLGATAGAVVGNNVARNSDRGGYNASYPVYRVTVQTDNGALRTYDVNATGDLRAGDRVRIENGMIYMG